MRGMQTPKEACELKYFINKSIKKSLLLFQKDYFKRTTTIFFN